MAELRDQLQTSLGTAYTLERELGGGGMSRVFLATEPALGRQVVVKVLPPELGSELSAERFRREIKLAAALQHPHIVPVLTAGDAGGLLYYTTPWVAGESLRQRLVREKQLPIDEAVRLTTELAEALAFAHERGVVHRDVKPENVLLSDGHALLLDFGIGKALEHAKGETLTATGLSIGTPPYMSPEQASGAHDLDGRADIYSLGCVLYEMLAGEPPFTGPTAQAVIAKHMAAPFPQVRHSRPDVPAGVEAVIAKATAKVPGDRYATARVLADALRQSTSSSGAVRSKPRMRVAAAVSVVVLAVLGYLLLRPHGTSLNAAEARVIAVLPFENDSRDSAQEYFSDGIADDITTALGNMNIPGLRVTARTSAFSLKGKHATPQDIRKTLGVGSVVEGSVRRLGDRVRVTAELVRTSDGTQLWSNSFDRQTKDLYSIQHEITASIAEALQAKLQTSPAQVRAHDSKDPEAHDLYLRARFLAALPTNESLVKALELYKEALARDSTFALAYAGIAQVYDALADGYMAPDIAYPKAEAAAARAIALDSTLGEAWGAAALVNANSQWDWPRAWHDIERAHALNPSEPLSYLAETFYWGSAMQRPDRALAAAYKARTVDPVSPFTNLALMWVYFEYENNPDSTLAADRRLQEIAPGLYYADNLSGWSFLRKGLTAKAESAFKAAEAPLGHRSFGLGYLYATTGRRAEGLAVAHELEQQAKKMYLPPEWIGAIYAGLGDRERMYPLIERAVATHSGSAQWLGSWFVFRPYMREPRYQALLRRMGLPEPAS